MDKLNTLLPLVLSKYNLNSEARAAYVLQRVKIYLEEVLEFAIENEIVPYKYKDGIVFIAVKTSVLAQELNLSKQKLIDLLKEKEPNLSLLQIKINQTRKI
jgi:hypothetical protein